LSDRIQPNHRHADTVILLHGLGGTDWNLRYLGSRLERSGLRVEYYRYPSRKGQLEDAARGLADQVERAGEGRVHLVGHSLGGIVIARMLEAAPSPQVGRLALIGCPIQGSEAVEALLSTRLGRNLIGPVAWEGIVERRPRAPAGREILVVAGTLPLGVGLLIGLPRPHDGWIQVPETHVDGARVILSRAWHFGMLFSRKVADSLVAFFNGGL
jgi:pimeloyl-ACP methyl ester carboxylesterase